MMVQVVKDKNDQVIVENVQVRERFMEYFDELLNFEKEREAIEREGIRRLKGRESTRSGWNCT